MRRFKSGSSIVGRVRQINCDPQMRVQSHLHKPLTLGYGLAYTQLAFGWYPRWRWGVEALPDEPTYPMSCPGTTVVPVATPLATACEWA